LKGPGGGGFYWRKYCVDFLKRINDQPPEGELVRRGKKRHDCEAFCGLNVKGKS